MVRYWLILAASALSAQTLSFEVASVRLMTTFPGERAGRSPIATSAAGLTARGATLRDCIQWAWRVPQYEVVGPASIDSDRFDIAAKSAAPASADDLRAMLRTLLANRFRLELHHDTRLLPIWALAPGRHGAKLHRSRADSPEMRKLPGGGLRLAFRKTSMPDLAAFLSTLAVIDRPVRDASGLAGDYDFTLDLHEVAGPWASEAERLAAPAFSTVLEEQLGLRMESRKDSVEVLVVDRVERPDAN